MAVHHPQPPAGARPKTRRASPPGPDACGWRRWRIGSRCAIRARVVAISNKRQGRDLPRGARDASRGLLVLGRWTGRTETGPSTIRRRPMGGRRRGRRALQPREGRREAGAPVRDTGRLPAPRPEPSPGFASGLDGAQEPYVGRSLPHDLTKAEGPFPSQFFPSPFPRTGCSPTLALDLARRRRDGLGRDRRPRSSGRVVLGERSAVSHDYGPSRSRL